MKLLVENGALINNRNRNGKTPFHKAVSYGSATKDLDIIAFLMENGADLKLRTKECRNNSIELALKSALEEGSTINIVKKLIHN